MEVIVPLFILFIFSLIAAGVAFRLTRTWTRGRDAAVVAAFLLPGLYIGSTLGLLNLRDDYHHRHSETYNLDGNCVVALGYGYTLEFFDEFPGSSQILRKASGTEGNYNNNGVSVWLLEQGVRRVGVTASGVYGAAMGHEDTLNDSIDHYFWIDPARGRVERYETEAELRSKIPGLGQMMGPDHLFSNQENRERSIVVTGAILLLPIALVIFCCYRLRRWQTMPSRNEVSGHPHTSVR